MKKIYIPQGGGRDFWLRIPMNNESAGRHLCMDDVHEEDLHVWLESGYGGCWTLEKHIDGGQRDGIAAKVPASTLGYGTYSVVMAGKFVNGDYFRTKRQLFIRLVDREDQADAEPTMYNEEQAYWAGPAVLSEMLSRDGLNTYELAVIHGYEGTLEEFLAQQGIELQDLMVTKAKLSREVQTQLDRGSEKAITPKGEYSASATYAVNDLVYVPEVNASYVSLISVNEDNYPPYYCDGDDACWMKTTDGEYIVGRQVSEISSALTGYFTCGTDGDVSTKQVSNSSDYHREVNGGAMKVKMTNANTASNVKMQFANDVSPITLLYNGETVDENNTWEAGEVISVYYDGTYNNNAGAYFASNAQGGGGKAEKIKYDSSVSGLAADNVQEALDDTVVEKRILNLGNPLLYFIDNDGVWVNENFRHYIVKVSAGDKILVIAKDNLPAVYRFLKEPTATLNGNAVVSDIDGGKHLIEAGKSETATVPSDALYLYVQGLVSSIDFTPKEVSIVSTVKEKVSMLDNDRNVLYNETPFRQGSIAQDGITELESEIEISSKGFISVSKSTTIKAKDGYVITRVFSYNRDLSLYGFFNYDSNPQTQILLDNPTYLYKFVVINTAASPITPQDDCIELTPIKEYVDDLMKKALINKAKKTVYVAASDSTDDAKAIADYVCDGVNDEVEIQNAINSLTYGGTVQLLDGRYNIDAFPQTIDNGARGIEHVAIFIGGTRETPRTLTIKGTTENKTYNSKFGVHIHVSSSAIADMSDEDIYVCIKGSGQRPRYLGEYTFINNVYLEKFHLYIGDAEKKIVGIDCTHFGGARIEHIGVYTESHFSNRFNHVKPPTPAEGSVGIIATCGANDAMVSGYSYVECSGMYIGFYFHGLTGSATEHLIMACCAACRCCYGYYFECGASKTMTLINCCDEGNTHLPHFGRKSYKPSHITCLDFNIERFDSAYYPDDPTGNTEWYAVEEDEPENGIWIGTLEYTLETSNNGGATDGIHFWKNDGVSGKGIRTRNLNEDHTGYSQPNAGEYLEQYFDTSTNTWKTWNGSAWV